MSINDEETQGLLRNTHKRSKGNKFLIVVSAALVFTSLGVIVSLLRHDALYSGTNKKKTNPCVFHYTNYKCR